MTFSCLFFSLCFSSFCCPLKIESPNHQRSAVAKPLGTDFSKRVPEMSLINSLRRRAHGRVRWWESERGWTNNDREMERVKDGVVQRGRWGGRGGDNEKEGSERERVEVKQGLWGKNVEVNKAEGEGEWGALIRHRTKAPSHFTYW